MTLGLRDLAFLGGGAPAVPWTPAQLGGVMRVWLDADDASTISLNGSFVTQWRDKSGLNNHFSQTTAGLQMSYQAAAVNGRAAVVDLGTGFANVFMETSPSLPVNLNGSGMTIVGVGRPEGTGTNGINRFILIPNYLWFGTWFLSSSFTGGDGWATAAFGDGSTWTLQGTTSILWDDTLRVVGATVDASGNASTYVDGALGGSGFQAWANFSGGIHLNHVFGGSQQWRGPMCEVLIMVDVLGTSDRQKLEGYLAHKWQGAGASNSLPSGHPFKATAPTV